MKNTAVTNEETQVQEHPLTKSYTFVSDRHVDYNKLSAFEAISLSAVLILAVAAGVITSTIGTLA